MNPPKKITVIIAAVLAVLGLILGIAISGKAVIGLVIEFLAAALLIAASFIKGL